MMNLFLILLSAAVATASWSGHYSRAIAANQDLDWWEHGTFYEIYPRSFKDSDGDGVGDIRGIIDNLDHLKDLGVTGFWLGPIFQSPMIDGGNDVTNFYEVNPLFGTNQDLKELFAKAKELDLKVVIDFVPNHTSDQHIWFYLSAMRFPGFEDVYIWRDCVLEIDGSRRMPNNWIGVYHTRTWSYNEIREQCYLHHYAPEQPDLNLRHEEVYNAILDVVRYWLEQGVDGFRIDPIRLFETANLPNELLVNGSGDWNSRDNFIHFNTVNRPESYEFIRDVRKVIDDFVENSIDKASKVLLTDSYQSFEQQVLWFGDDETRPASHVPMNVDLFTHLNKDSDASDFKETFNDFLDVMPWWGEPNWVLGNHDTPRIGHRFGVERHESLAILSLLLPGPYMIYYGEEILMTDNRNITLAEADDPQSRLVNETVFAEITRDPARTPFQWDDSQWAGFSNTTDRTWLPVHSNYQNINLKAQKEAQRSTYKLYQSLIELRRTRRVLQIGGYDSTVVDTRVFGFIRTLIGHQTIAVIVNLGDEEGTYNLRDMLGDDYTDNASARILIVNYNSTLQVGSSISNTGSVRIGPYDAIVLEVSSATKLAISMLMVVCSLIKFIL